MSRIKVYFDAACWNKVDNNNDMGLGVAVYIDDIYQEEISLAQLVSDHYDRGTNNIGEWMALILALKTVKELLKDFPKCGTIEVYGDSKLVVSQYNGEWRIKEKKFQAYCDEARKVSESFKSKLRVMWVPREQNKQADKLSKEGLKLKTNEDESK